MMSEKDRQALAARRKNTELQMKPAAISATTSVQKMPEEGSHLKNKLSGHSQRSQSNKGFANVNHYDKSAGAIFTKKTEGHNNPDIAVESTTMLNNDLQSFRSTQNSVE